MGRWILQKIAASTVFLGMTVLASWPAQAQFFSIQKFHADLLIHEDSSFLVKETIEVKLDRPRHGIYRDIPYRYVDDTGKEIRTPLKILAVTDGSGKDRRYKTSKRGNIVRLRIGDPKEYVLGLQTYVIVYRVENALLFFADRDELYWNVTGNYWPAPIFSASVAVAFSDGGKSQNLWGGCYTGAYGAKEGSCRFDLSENSGRFSTLRPLQPREGFTIAFAWEKGMVSPPSSWKKFLWAVNLAENWVFILPLFSFFFMAGRWYRRGRDPRVREAVRVMYAPPQFDQKPLNPAEVGTLVDEKLDPRDITATVVGLAAKGYLKIEENRKEGLLFDSADYALIRVKEPDKELSSFEERLMKFLLPGTIPAIALSQLKNKFYANLKILKETLYGDLVKKGYFAISPEKVRNRYVLIAVLISFMGLFASFILAEGNLLTTLACGLTGLPILVFAGAMPAKTRRGALAYMDILGFQEFMDRADKDRLQRMGEKDLFYKYLPYAIALGVVDHWAEAFEGIYQEPPQWYISPVGMRTFSPSRFSRSLNTATSSLTSAMFAAPRGSGSGMGRTGGGGGGFSGGGFGGGGGGTW
jgi:hypothetical protein